jgi:hypothetical protein
MASEKKVKPGYFSKDGWAERKLAVQQIEVSQQILAAQQETNRLLAMLVSEKVH